MAKLYSIIAGFMVVGNIIDFLQMTHVVGNADHMLDPTTYSFWNHHSTTKEVQQASIFLFYWLGLTKLFFVMLCIMYNIIKRAVSKMYSVATGIRHRFSFVATPIT